MCHLKLSLVTFFAIIQIHITFPYIGIMNEDYTQKYQILHICEILRSFNNPGEILGEQSTSGLIKGIVFYQSDSHNGIRVISSVFSPKQHSSQ